METNKSLQKINLEAEKAPSGPETTKTSTEETETEETETEETDPTAERRRQATVNRYRNRVQDIPARFRGYRLSDCEVYESLTDKQTAVQAARVFASNRGRIRHRERLRTALLLGGGYGVGKTVLATAVYKALLWQMDHPDDPSGTLTATWAKWHTIVSQIQSTYSPGAETDRARVLGRYQNADLLLLDDVGDLDKDMQSDDRRRILYEIIDVRSDWMRPTILTSNVVSITKLKAQFGERTFERLKEMCAFYLMGGANLRDNDPSSSSPSTSSADTQDR